MIGMKEEYKTKKLRRDELMKVSKFVLASEMVMTEEKVSALKDVVSIIWEKVEEVSSDKELELIKRKIHSNYLDNEWFWFDREMEDWIWDILFNNKEGENE